MLKRLFKIAVTGLFFLSAVSLDGTQDIAATLSKISDQDRNHLDRFFQCLLRESPTGYTLFGNKPITLIEYPWLKLSVNCDLEFSLCMEKGWETWIRTQSLFPSGNFVLKKEEIEGFLGNRIVLINKSQVLAAISENLDLFKLKFGEEFDREELLRQICDTDESFFDFFKEQALIGILLGFGRSNGVFFSRECEIAGYLQSKITPPFSRLQINPRGQDAGREAPCKDSHSSSFHSLVEEFNVISDKRSFFHLPGDGWFLNVIGSPHFVDYGEDSALIDAYVKTRRAIRKAYQKGSFLEVTLTQWANPQFLGETQ